MPVSSLPTCAPLRQPCTSHLHKTQTREVWGSRGVVWNQCLEVCLVLRPKDLVKGVTRPRKCLSLSGNKLLEFQTETCSTDFLGTLTS